MREIASRIPSGLRRIPDGETGDRGNWIFFQLQKFLQLPWLVPARFQVEYPTPLASISGYIVSEQQQALLDSYERAMFADLDRLLAAIPADEVAVQWDVTVEFGVLEEAFAPGGAQAFDAIIAALARCVDEVPAEIPVGLHFCYGDYGHRRPWPPARAARVPGVSAPNAGWAA
jgi:hypothetical protein